MAWQNPEMQLMPGDSVVIKQATGSINIKGKVYNPGLIEYQPGKSLKYYIESAGGITPSGDYKTQSLLMLTELYSQIDFLINLR